MAETTMTHTGTLRPDGLRGVAADWSSDQRAFKNVSWGKAMMWIFLLSDTFVFGCFLLSYMTARMSTKVPWPNASEVFATLVYKNAFLYADASYAATLGILLLALLMIPGGFYVRATMRSTRGWVI